MFNASNSSNLIQQNSNISNFSNSTFLSFISLCSTSTIILINQSNYIFVAYQFVAFYIDIMFFDYSRRLIIFTKWFHNKSSIFDLIATKFHHKLNTKNNIFCSKCDLKWFKWFIDEIFLQFHLKKNDCLLIQKLKKLKTFTNKNKTSTIISMMSIASSNSRFNQSKIKNIVNFKIQTKIKFFKFDEIANNFNSISIKSCFEFNINVDITFKMLLLWNIIKNEKTVKQIAIETKKIAIVAKKNN